MQNEATQTRAQTFTNTIYALAEALMPFIRAIGRDHGIRAKQCDRAIARLNRVLQQILALTALMNPSKLGATCFRPLRPRPLATAPSSPATERRTRTRRTTKRGFSRILGALARHQPATPLATNPQPHPAPHPESGPRTPRDPNRPPGPRRLLSARQTAKRLEDLLHELEQAAAEIGYKIPSHIQALCHQARTIAGCDTLYPADSEPASDDEPGTPAPTPHPTTSEADPWQTLEL